MNDIIRTLQFEKEQLEAKNRLLQEKIESDNRHISAYDAELREAKRLLKAAAKIVKNLPCDDDNCSECIHNDKGYVCSEYECFEWRYADEALVLIGGESDD